MSAYSQSKDSSTASYSGVPVNDQTGGLTQAGSFKTGTAVAPVFGPNPVPGYAPSIGGQVQVAVGEGLPAAVMVQLTKNNGIVQTGSPQQYSVRIQNGSTLQLTPLTANAQNQLTSAVAPNVFTYSFTSRNSHVATVDANGLVTAVSRGEVEIVIQSTRSVNASFVGATPSGTEGVSCSLNVTVTA
jgi:hypothetical protein